MFDALLRAGRPDRQHPDLRTAITRIRDILAMREWCGLGKAAEMPIKGVMAVPEIAFQTSPGMHAPLQNTTVSA